jgi:osmotically-inducible protein OsmY
MKTIQFVGAVSVAVATLLVSTGSFAQSSGAMAMPMASSGAAAPSAKAMRIANRKLAKQVRAALTKAKPALPMTNITVIAKGGVVSLTGSVPSQDQSAQATTVAQGVPGVSSVNNKLSIKQPGN